MTLAHSLTHSYTLTHLKLVQDADMVKTNQCSLPWNVSLTIPKCQSTLSAEILFFVNSRDLTHACTSPPPLHMCPFPLSLLILFYHNLITLKSVYYTTAFSWLYAHMSSHTQTFSDTHIQACNNRCMMYM